jgi:microsomal dipeptidase-like Zn-dependent dipeptidase
VKKGMNQCRIYKELPSSFICDIVHHTQEWNLDSPLIATRIAIENASGFCSEDEPLAEGFKRLHFIIHQIEKPLYISLTWNMENRFGGGTLSQSGLKEDGKRLLEELHGQGIAIDLSHASDRLAYEMIDYIEGHGLELPLMASHSNARAIASVPRNLPDEIAREIFRRGGIVGLNFYGAFIGESEDFFPKQIVHWLELGGEKNIVLGADFFYEGDSSNSSKPGQHGYFHDYQDATCYERLLNLLQKELRLNSSILEGLAHRNALAFLSY